MQGLRQGTENLELISKKKCKGFARGVKTSKKFQKKKCKGSARGVKTWKKFQKKMQGLRQGTENLEKISKKNARAPPED
jgi:hypothetical protein